MQQQHKRPRSRLSVTEGVVAWLLILWGLFSGIVGSEVALQWSARPLFFLPLVLQGAFCLLGGIATLLHLRPLLRLSLNLVAGCWILLAGLFAWLAWVFWPSAGWERFGWIGLLGGGGLLIALGCFMLGRWLASREGPDATI